MSVRVPGSGIPRPGLPTTPRKPDEAPKKDSAKPGSSTGKSSSTGASGKASGGGKAGAKRAATQDGMEARGAGAGGVGAGGFESLGGEGTQSRWKQPSGGAGQPPPQAPAGREAPLSVPTPELQRGEREAANEERPSSGREAVESRAQLRSMLMERLLRGMADIQGRLSKFLENPGRTGVVSLSMVMSESSVTHELWKEAMASAEGRARLAHTLGFPESVDERALVRTLMDEVHVSFTDFQASRQGKESRQSYQELLGRYEEANVLPVVAGHDTGLMPGELNKLGVPYDKDFTRSLFLDEQVVAVGLSADEGSATQVMVSGMTAPQLGTVIAQIRRTNPRLTNKQVRHLLFRASSDLRTSVRKSLGQAEVNRAQELARQLLKLQAVEHLLP